MTILKNTKEKVAKEPANEKEVSVRDGTGDKAVEDFLCRHWKQAWQDFIGLEATFYSDGTDRTSTFLTRARERFGGRIFYVQDDDDDDDDESSNTILGAVVCQQWQGPVPIEVVNRDVLSIGTIWGLHLSDELRGKRAAVNVRKSLLRRALQHLCEIKCHKVVVQSLSPADTEAYMGCGFEYKNMMTVSLVGGDFTDNPTTLIDTGGDTLVQIQNEGKESDAIVVDHWRKMWREVGIPNEGIVERMEDMTLSFVENARESLCYQTFVARDSSNGRVLGSVCCQRWDGPYPQVVQSRQIGTIWAVYVNPDVRRKGIATALMKSALGYLTNISCDECILIAASEAGQRVYERLGFARNNALVFEFQARLPGSPDDCSEANLSDVLAKLLESAGVSDLSKCVVDALVTATAQQLLAVFYDHPLLEQIIATVINFQSDHRLYINPKDNWFTQNIKKFGHGFALARKFDRLSEHYDHWTVGNRSKVERFIVSCAKELLDDARDKGSGLRILDTACGIGLQGQTLRMCGFEGELVGNDVSPGMIARVVERGCYSHAYVANANHGFSTDTASVGTVAEFDAVICTGAMELLDQPTALGHMARATKTGGALWLTFQQDDKEAGVHRDPTHHQNVKGIKKARVVELLSEAGLQAMSIEPCPDAFYTPSPEQDGSLIPVPYLFVVAKKI